MGLTNFEIVADFAIRILDFHSLAIVPTSVLPASALWRILVRIEQLE